MADRLGGYESARDSLLKRGILIDDEKERELHKSGYKTAVIQTDVPGEIYKLRFNTDSLNVFFRAIGEYQELKNINKKNVLLPGIGILFLDQVLLVQSDRENDFYTADLVEQILEDQPWLERTTAYLRNSLPGGEYMDGE